ncbi:MAG TPA: biotin/lipoyl-binding protein, partial [Thermoanaerobaculia bacterium]
MMRFLNKTFILLIVALTIVACSKKDNATVTTTQAPPLPSDVAQVAAVATTSSVSTASATESGATQTDAVTADVSGGRIAATGEFVSPVRSELAAKMPGRVARMYVDEGSRVSKGQPLVELESDYVR